MTDQLRRDALGCYGNRVCRTPNLDRVAASGACFDNAFTVSPVCSPARASLLTGLYPHNHGVMLNTHIAPAWSPGLSPALPTFSRILNDAGYVLDYVGKWHVHKELKPQHFGFARALGEGFGGPKPELVAGSQIAVDFAYGARQLIAGTTGATAQETPLVQRTRTGIKLIRERAAQSQPFMVRMDMPEPRFPCLPPELYDLENDAGELVNRIADPACQAVREEMKARLLGWNDATSDMFQWLWVRWNFPEPIPPDEAARRRS